LLIIDSYFATSVQKINVLILSSSLINDNTFLVNKRMF
jgi:hypothetical protein